MTKPEPRSRTPSRGVASGGETRKEGGSVLEVRDRPTDAGSPPLAAPQQADGCGVQAQYVELRCHSAFSFLDGASQPEDLVERAAELGYHALALTDRDGFYGAPRFYQAAKRLAAERAPETAARPVKRIGDAPARGEHETLKSWPLKPILGAELSLEGGVQLLVLIERREGYRNLSRLLTKVRLDAAGPHGGKVAPVIPMAHLAANAEGLVALTGGLEGAIGRALATGDGPAAERALSALVEIFGARNLYVELQRHFDADEGAAESAAPPAGRANGPAARGDQ